MSADSDAKYRMLGTARAVSEEAAETLGGSSKYLQKAVLSWQPVFIRG